MEIGLTALVLLPAFLGLLGFIEPCSIGGHLLFLETQNRRLPAERLGALAVFILTRAIVMGLFGALIALLGARLIGVQTGMWLVFGVLFLGLGLLFLAGRSRHVRRGFDLAPAALKRLSSPLAAGLALGLNIPACAAPILFGLLGLAAGAGSLAAGFLMMFVFGVFLSLPLAVIALVPGLSPRLEALGGRLAARRSLTGVIFVVLGVWSLWFGLFVNPADWSGTAP